MQTIYFDNNATTMVAPEVTEAMLPFFTTYWGNPSSMHTFGGQVAKYVDEAREQVADLFNAKPQEIIFTSCGTESDNTAIWTALQTRPGKKHIVTTAVEHPAILETCAFWERNGYTVTRLGVDEKGNLDLEEYANALTPDTAIVSIMYANNEIGNIYPIPQMAEMAKERGILFHTDAVQAAGKVDIDLSKVPVDMLSISGHKIHCPKGIGMLYVRKGVLFRPFIRGGHQERGRRGGTENVPYIVGLGKACQMAKEGMADELTRVAALRDKLEAGILARVPECKVNGDPAHRLPGTTNIAFIQVCPQLHALLPVPLQHGRRSGFCNREHSPGDQDPARPLPLQGLVGKLLTLFEKNKHNLVRTFGFSGRPDFFCVPFCSVSLP